MIGVVGAEHLRHMWECFGIADVRNGKRSNFASVSHYSFATWLAALLRNRVARIGAFTIAPVLFMLWWQMGGAPGEVLREAEAAGVVAEVHKHAYLITLDDGAQVRVFRTRRLDKGARVTLHASHFESGVTQYVLPGEDAAQDDAERGARSE